jgi:Flp pilus assembly pilin Flp
VKPPADRTYDGLNRLFNLYRLTELNPRYYPGRSRMQKLWVRFGREVDGQDLLEYTFLLAVILLASVALMMNVGPGASAIWNQTTVTLNQGGGGPAASGPRAADRKLPEADKEAGPAVLSWLLWNAETSGPARPDPPPQPKQLTEAAALWRRRPTDPDKPIAN